MNNDIPFQAAAGTLFIARWISVCNNKIGISPYLVTLFNSLSIDGIRSSAQ